MLGVFTKKPVGEQARFVPIIAVLNESIHTFIKDSFFIFYLESYSLRKIAPLPFSHSPLVRFSFCTLIEQN
jgi:hypothetical protein